MNDFIEIVEDLNYDLHVPLAFKNLKEQLEIIYKSNYLNEKELDIFLNFIYEYNKIIERLFL